MTPQGRVLVIEPHADDAFLSLGGTLMNWTQEGVGFDIFTIFAHSKRAEEAATFAHKVKALSHKTLFIEKADLHTTSVTDIQAIKIMIVHDVLELVKYYGISHVVAPLGIQHPEHRIVAAAMRDFGQTKVWRYMDIPYYTKLMNANEVDIKIQNMRMLSCVRARPAKWNMIPIFKTQAKFFHFNKKESLKEIPEIILEDI